MRLELRVFKVLKEIFSKFEVFIEAHRAQIQTWVLIRFASRNI